MTYVDPNYKTKKALQEALRQGHPVKVFEPSHGQVPQNGPVYLEGPHHPEPHCWYAQGQMKDGKLVSIK